MQICRTIDELDVALGHDSARVPRRPRGGFVPTMGALHEGHLALIRRAREAAMPVIVSIFVNPTQFGPNEDFSRYPRALDVDIAAAGSAGADIVFAPETEIVYPPDREIPTPPLPRVATEPELEDAHRPGHFAGVCQVVARLFDLVQPAAAIFGEKDYQQLLVIRAMTAAQPMRWPGLTIIAHPTMRDPDGLAMSSRNRYLTSEQRARALGLSRALTAAREANRPDDAERIMRQTLERHDLSVDYSVVRDAATLCPVADFSKLARALIAARLDAVRLIDNAPLPARA